MAEKKEVTPTKKTASDKNPSFIEAIKWKDIDTLKEMAGKVAKENIEYTKDILGDDIEKIGKHPLAKKFMKKFNEIKKK